MVTHMISQAVYFASYGIISEQVKEMRSEDPNYKNTTIDFILITTLAGLLCATLCNPLWLINTRMVTSKDDKPLLKTVLHIFKYEGWQTFYNGLLPNMIMVLNPIINFVCYESLKQRLGGSKAITSMVYFAISSFSKSLATFLTYPILTIRVRLHASVALRTVTPGTTLATKIQPTGHSFAKRVRDNIAHTI